MNDSGTWLAVSMVEGPHSMYPPDQRITAAWLKEAAEAYDPSLRRAKVICGWDPSIGAAGPAHKMGRFLPPVAEIEEAKFDGKYLHVRVRQNQDADGRPAMKSRVDRGFTEVSVALMPTSDLPGNPRYIDHVALLAGELPGTAGLPSLREAFRALEEAGLSDLTSLLPPEAPEIGLDGWAKTTSHRSLSQLERSWIPPTEEDGLPADKELEMTPELEKDIAAAVTRALTEALPGAVKAAVASEVGTLTQDLTTVRTLAETAQAAAVAAKEEAGKLADSSAAAGLEGRLRSCVNSGRLRPAEMDDDLLTLRALPGTEREAFVARREARAPMRSLTQPLPYLPVEEVPADLAEFADPHGTVRVLPETADLHTRVMAEIKGDMTRYNETAKRLERAN